MTKRIFQQLDHQDTVRYSKKTKAFKGNKSFDPDFCKEIENIECPMRALSSYELIKMFIDERLNKLKWKRLFLNLSIEDSNVREFFHILHELKDLGYSQNDIYHSIIELLVSIYCNHTTEQIKNVFSHSFFINLLCKKIGKNPTIYIEFINKCNDYGDKEKFNTLRETIKTTSLTCMK